jgi:hypothetical protein
MKKIIYLIAAMFLLALVFGIYLFNKKPQDVRTVQADYQLNAEELVRQFSDNEDQANQQYLDKIIQVRGRVKEITLEGYSATVFLDSGDPISGVTCSFYEEEAGKLKDIKVDQIITVKGKCTGKLMDVVMNNCSLSQ